MQAREALEAFKRYAQDHGKGDLRVVTGSEALDLMTGFYRDVRADDCDLESGGDLLFCAWGAFDWGQGEHFELQVFRQFFFPPADASVVDGALVDADDYIWHLDLMLSFTPSSELRELGRDSRICQSLAELAAFNQSVRSSAAFAAVQGRSDGEVILRFECAG